MKKNNNLIIMINIILVIGLMLISYKSYKVHLEYENYNWEIYDKAIGTKLKEISLEFINNDYQLSNRVNIEELLEEQKGKTTEEFFKECYSDLYEYLKEEEDNKIDVNDLPVSDFSFQYTVDGYKTFITTRYLEEEETDIRIVLYLNRYFKVYNVDIIEGR